MGNALCTEQLFDVQGDEESGWLFNVLVFCDRQTRATCLFITNRHYRILTTDSSYLWRIERLHIEHGIYFPSTLPKCRTWRSIFLDLDKKRCLWQFENVSDISNFEPQRSKVEKGDDYSISVYARMKPLSCDRDHTQNGRKTTLPLHQRLALIRIDKCLDSNKDALFVLKEQGGWFKNKWEQIEQSSSSKEKVTKEEKNLTDHLTSGIKMIDVNKSRVIVVDGTKGLREFEFDGVMNENSSQQDVYTVSTRGLVSDVINGISATCLVYGQTGSGKSFTMFGDQTNHDVNSSFIGIVPRACSELMSAVHYRKESINLNIDCIVTVSFVEIYGNDILDLLKCGSRVGQSKVSAQRSVLDGSIEVTVSNITDMLRLLRLGEAQRRKAATAMNSISSRAHCVFIVTLNQKCHDTGKTICSKLFLADLGGCEQTKKSQLYAGKSKHIEALKELEKDMQTEFSSTDQKIEAEYSTGFVKSDRMREAVYINLGLMSLKSCVEALHHGTHVPYSSSKLTMLLSSGLGGNSKTAIIVCVSQEDEHFSETISALKFGQVCRRLSNTVRTQSDVLGDLMENLNLEIENCEERIRKNEKWIVQEEKRKDCLAEIGSLEAVGFGGIEVRKTTILVGAEEDRKLLHRLLFKKSQLSGSASSAKIEVGNANSCGTPFGGNIGFGKAHEYGLGHNYSLAVEKENYRFNNEPRIDLVPESVKSIKQSNFVTRATKRGRLAYSGISA